MLFSRFVILLFVTMVLFISESQAGMEIDNKSVTRAVAVDLIKSLDKFYKLKGFGSLFKLSSKRIKPRIAVWPFQKEKIPVSKQAADELNELLVSALLKKGSDRYEFIARDSLRTIISDMEETGKIDDAEENPVATLMESAQNIAALIIGKIVPDNGNYKVVYKVVTMDGKIVAVTEPKKLSREFTRSSNQAVLSLDQGIVAAVKYFADRAHDMVELHLDSIRYEDSGLQPAFGRYILEKVSTALQEKYSNTLSENALLVRDSQLDLTRLSTTRGINISSKDLKTWGSNSNGVYTLTGSYWILGNAIDIRVSLKGASGKSISWSNRVRMNTVPKLKLYPKQDFGALRANDNQGPIALTLTTERGEDPKYKIGEKMKIVIRLSRDSWVYCYYRQANGETIQVFPNPYFWSIYSEPKLEAKKVHLIPGDNIFPFDLNVRPPTGEEVLKCFAASKNITELLPKALRGLSLEPIPKSIDRQLGYIFQSIPNGNITEASTVITVIQ